MLAPSLHAFLAPSTPLSDASRGYGSFDLAPTRDRDSLIATFAMFIARLGRCTEFDLAFAEPTATPPVTSATLHIRLDPKADVAAMHHAVDTALTRARAGLDARRLAVPLPVGVALVARLDEPSLTPRLLTLVLAESGAARWRFDPKTFSRAHIHALADQFTRLLALRATSQWSRASFSGVHLNLGFPPSRERRSVARPM